MMQELEQALAQEAPLLPKQSNANVPGLPAFPAPLDKMTLTQLRSFIPKMLKWSTGRSKPGWGKPECMPIWWPKDLPYDVCFDERPEEMKKTVSWSYLMKTAIANCYKHHNLAYLLPKFYAQDNHTESKPENLPSVTQIDPGHASQPLIVALSDGTVAEIVLTQIEPTQQIVNPTIVQEQVADNASANPDAQSELAYVYDEKSSSWIPTFHLGNDQSLIPEDRDAPAICEENRTSENEQTALRLAAGTAISWKTCCVTGCINNTTRDERSNTSRSYHCFPKESTRAYALWLLLLGREEDWKPSKHDRVCSDHFINGTRTDTAGSSGYVPVLYTQEQMLQKSKKLDYGLSKNFTYLFPKQDKVISEGLLDLAYALGIPCKSADSEVNVHIKFGTNLLPSPKKSTPSNGPAQHPSKSESYLEDGIDWDAESPVKRKHDSEHNREFGMGNKKKEQHDFTSHLDDPLQKRLRLNDQSRSTNNLPDQQSSTRNRYEDENATKGPMEKKKKWSAAATLLLLDMMEARVSDFQNFFYAKKDLYTDISRCFSDKGMHMTPKDVEIKWGNLTRTYKTDLLKKHKNGPFFERSAIFDQLERIIGDKYAHKIASTLNTSQKRTVKEEPKAQEEEPKAQEKEYKVPEKKNSSNDSKKKLVAKLDEALVYLKESDEKFLEERRAMRKQEERKIALLEALVQKA